MNEYENDLKIDEHSLDQEWLQQPIKFLKYSELAANVNKAYLNLKDRLEIVKADLDQTLRKQAKDSGEKVTEAIIGSRILIHPDYLECQKQLSEAKNQYDILIAAVKAFEHRKKALENLVPLYLSGYYSSPRQNSHAENKWNEERKNSLRKRLNQEEE